LGRDQLGAAVGFASGLTGVGGGVFLAQLLIALHWDSPRQKTALSAPFILVNSVVGFAGATYTGRPADTWWFAAAVIGGAIIGTIVGLRWWSQTLTRNVLAVILLRQEFNCYFSSAHCVFEYGLGWGSMNTSGEHAKAFP
jgi:uncharacterized membrane protein YfcA